MFVCVCVSVPKDLANGKTDLFLLLRKIPPRKNYPPHSKKISFLSKKNICKFSNCQVRYRFVLGPNCVITKDLLECHKSRAIKL